MKKAVFLSLLALLAIGAASPLTLPIAKITVKTLDEEGQPITGASVAISFERAIPQWGGGTPVNVEGKTDSNGEFSASGHSFDSLGALVQKKGYYSTWPQAAKFTDSVAGQWQPWNPTIEAVLKKVVNPIPMYARKLRAEIPIVGQPVGFDLAASDWMPPYGKGKTADFIFQLKKEFASRKDYTAAVNLTFANEGDGIQAVRLDDKGLSALRFPRMAPEAGYASQWDETWGHAKNGPITEQKTQRGYFFRVRTTKKDDEIKSALYGKIDGDILFDAINSKTAWVVFTYYLNPNVNDTNLEFDPQRNLFVSLKDEERVKAP
jgi:hypothetical protein